MKSLSWNLWGCLSFTSYLNQWGETNPFVETPQKIETTIAHKFFTYNYHVSIFLGVNLPCEAEGSQNAQCDGAQFENQEPVGSGRRP